MEQSLRGRVYNLSTKRYGPGSGITCVIEVIRMQHAIQIYTRVRFAHLYVKLMGELQQCSLKMKEAQPELSNAQKEKKHGEESIYE